MLRNEKGFSIVELLAIVFISSVIIWPLMTTLVGNIEINDRLQDRRSAVGIADSALYALDKITYSDIDDMVTVANGLGTYYIELNATTCTGFIADQDDTICSYIFSTTFNNLSLNPDGSTYKIYIYDGYLIQTEFDILVASLPSEVGDEMTAARAVLDFSDSYTDPNDYLLNVSVWIQYFDDPVSTIMVSGLIFDEIFNP